MVSFAPYVLPFLAPLRETPTLAATLDRFTAAPITSRFLVENEKWKMIYGKSLLDLFTSDKEPSLTVGLLPGGLIERGAGEGSGRYGSSRGA